MSDHQSVEASFPRPAYMQLLRRVEQRLQTPDDRAIFLSEIELASAAPESPVAVAAANEGRISNISVHVSSERFAAELVEKLAEPSRLELALTVARKIAMETSSMSESGALLVELDRLFLEQRKHALEQRVEPETELERAWMGFECVHHYSLADQFFGRAEQLVELDAWLTPDAASASIFCLSALGGGGKSALAWHWLNRALPTLRNRGYRGAFWCSFYEKDFDFSEFLGRALAFATGRPVEGLSRLQIERQLLEIFAHEPFVFVLDGLERLMNGYAIVFERAVDPDSIAHAKREEELTAHDRRLTDPRSGAFLRQLSGTLGSKLLITTRLTPAELEAVSDGRPLPHVRVLALKGLDPPDAYALWRNSNPQDRIDPELQTVLALSKYHPLVVSILARSVASAGGSWQRWRSLNSHRDFDPARGATDAEVRAHIVGVCLRDLAERAYDVLGVLTTSGKPMPLDLLSRVLRHGSDASGDERWIADEQVVTEVERLVALGFVGAAEPNGVREFDVHPVVRGAAWSLITDPKRERFFSHALSEFFATPDRHEQDIDLNQATSLFKLLVQSHEFDRAWDMYANKLWWPLALRSDGRTLLDLFELMLPQRDPLQLLALSSRREQANAAGLLGSLLMTAGDGPTADRLLRWCSIIRLQTGDFRGMLDARYSRSWHTLYEGYLFETTLDLTGTRVDALRFGAHEIVPMIDCWLGLVHALRGDRETATRAFADSERAISSARWWLQGVAEGYVYLNLPQLALDSLERAASIRLDSTDGRMQLAWEQLTRGMALSQLDRLDDALDELSKGLEGALRANYAIIQCFAHPYVAEIFLRRGQLEIAESHIEAYFGLDRESRYQLTATEAWRVRALCRLKREDRAGARECAARAYRLAACDGPPFVYHEALRRAFDVLSQCGAYVPETGSRLDPEWRSQLQQFKTEEAEERAIVERAPERLDSELTPDEARKQWRELALLREASERDRSWWKEITKEEPSGIGVPLAQAMIRAGVTLESFRHAYEHSTEKSLLLVFYTLQVESILPAREVRRVVELDEAARARWAEAGDEHALSLDHFLATEFAQAVNYTFEIHDLDSEGITAFLKDDKRRIGFGETRLGQVFWEALESQRTPRELLVLAEAMTLRSVKLAELLESLAIGTPRGIEYALAAIALRRALEELTVVAVSNTDSWSEVQAFLRLEDVKVKLGWRDASKSARELWGRVEKQHRTRLAPALRVAEELAVRRASLEDFYQAYLRSGLDDAQVNLALVDYALLKDVPWNGQPPRNTRQLSSSEAPFTFTETSSWTDERVVNRLGPLMQKLGFGETIEPWWSPLEREHGARALLRIAEELDVRGLTLRDLLRGRTAGGTENLAAAFAYMEFGTARSAYEHRALDHNTKANAHYLAGRYDAAIDSYESAIREDPLDPVYYSNTAMAWERLGGEDNTFAHQQAVEVLERGINRARDSTALRRALDLISRKKRVHERGGNPPAPSAKMLSVVTPIAVEVAADLASFFSDDTQMLDSVLPLMRDRIRDTTGVEIPPVRFRGNDKDLPAGSYVFMIDEIPIVMHSVSVGRSLIKSSSEALEALGIPFEETTDPYDGTVAHRIASNVAADMHFEAVDAPNCLVRDLERFIRTHLSRFVTHQAVAARLLAKQRMMTKSALDIVNDARMLNRFIRILRVFADEGVPSTALDSLCKAFCECERSGAEFDVTLQMLRALPEVQPALPGRYAGALFAFGAAAEQHLRDGLRAYGDERLLALVPETMQQLLSAVRDSVPPAASRAEPNVIVVEDALIRRYVRRLVELDFPEINVLARMELVSNDGRQVTPILL